MSGYTNGLPAIDVWCFKFPTDGYAYSSSASSGAAIVDGADVANPSNNRRPAPTSQGLEAGGRTVGSRAGTTGDDRAVAKLLRSA